INCVFSHVLAVCGIVGNMLNVAVFAQRNMKNNTNILFAWLSFNDVVFSCTQVISRLESVVRKFDATLATSVYICYNAYVYFWNQVALASSVYLVGVVAVERTVAVCFPFSAFRIVTSARVKLAIGLGYLLVIGLSSPWLFLFNVEWVTDPGTNRTVARMVGTEFLATHFRFITHDLYIAINVVLFYAPVAVISACTVMTTVGLAAFSRNRRLLSAAAAVVTSVKRKREMKSARTAVILCVMIVVLVFVPTGVLEMMTVYSPNYFNDNQVYILRCLQTVAYEASCAFNLVIYLMTSSKFAKTFKKLFCS
ncbi:unnamed protein product, partial [Lymnaea stagnalis]